MKKIATYTLLFLMTILSYGQTEEPKMPNLKNGTVEQQFDYIIKKSNRYQTYKVVRIDWLDIIKSNVIDSLNEVKGDLTSTQEIVDQQAKEIASLKADLENTNQTLDKTKNDKDSIKFFGATMKKAAYKSIVWSIVAALGGLLFIFIGRFAQSKNATAQTKKAHKEVMDEFNSYKNRAMESEQKLRRRLQDEINKNL